MANEYEEELQRLRTRHALGEVTDEELAAAEHRIAEQQATSEGPQASLTTRFTAMARGEATPDPTGPPIDTANWKPDVVAATAGSRTRPPAALIAVFVIAVLVVIVAAVLAAV